MAFKASIRTADGKRYTLYLRRGIIHAFNVAERETIDGQAETVEDAFDLVAADAGNEVIRGSYKLIDGDDWDYRR